MSEKREKLRRFLVKNHEEAIAFLNWVGRPAPKLDVNFTPQDVPIGFATSCPVKKMWINPGYVEELFKGIEKETIEKEKVELPIVASFVHEYLHCQHPKKSQYKISAMERELMYRKYPEFKRGRKALPEGSSDPLIEHLTSRG